MDEFDELADIADQANVIGKLTPREYAQLRGMAPQLVYYHIRQKHFELEFCVCGRRVIDVRTVDDFFTARSASKRGLSPEAIPPEEDFPG